MKSFIVEVTRDSQLIVKETKKEGIVKCLVSDLVIELNKNVDEIIKTVKSETDRVKKRELEKTLF